MENKAFNERQLLITVWTLTGFAIVFVLARCLIRMKLFKRVMLDDAFLIIALLCNIAEGVVITHMIPNLYGQEAVVYYHQKPPLNFHDIQHSFTMQQRADVMLFFTSLWGVKGSFLAFYGNLTLGLSGFRAAWGIIIGITILSYIGCLISYPLLNKDQGLSRSETKTDRTPSIDYEFSVDVATDVMIMLVPLTIAMNANLPFTRKLGLIGVFSSGLVITAFAILRFTLCNPRADEYGSSWIILLSAVQINVALMVACLAAFGPMALDRQRSKALSSDETNIGSGNFLSSQHARAFNVGGQTKVSALWPAEAGPAPYQRTHSEESMAIELINSRGSPPRARPDTLSHPAFAVGTTETPAYVR